jgi:hypothetical protein
VRLSHEAPQAQGRAQEGKEKGKEIRPDSLGDEMTKTQIKFGLREPLPHDILAIMLDYCGDGTMAEWAPRSTELTLSYGDNEGEAEGIFDRARNFLEAIHTPHGEKGYLIK